MQIILSWQVPSNQHIYLQRWHIKFMKKEAKILKAKRQEEVKKQREWYPMEWDIRMWIRYHHWSRTKRDIDNYAKLVLDSMTGICFNDDSQIQFLYLSKFYDKENPRVEIEIKQSRYNWWLDDDIY